jgi:ribosomal-protein-alanine N-acetyltransferase
LESPRLFIRHFNFEDVPFIIELVNSPGWLQFIGDRNIHTRSQAEKYLQSLIANYAIHPLGLSAVLLKDTNTAIGMCGVLKRDFLPGYDIGFALIPDAEGKGLAHEMSQLVIENFFGSFDEKFLLAMAHKDNNRSLQLLKKLGFQRDTIETERPDDVVLRLNRASTNLEFDSV